MRDMTKKLRLCKRTDCRKASVKGYCTLDNNVEFFRAEVINVFDKIRVGKNNYCVSTDNYTFSLALFSVFSNSRAKPEER